MSTRLITAGELLHYPTGLDWNTVAEDASATDPLQFIEQSFLIDSVSSWIGEYTGMPLGLHATQLTEQASVERAGMFPAKCLVDADGNLHFWTRTLPVISVTSGQWSYLLMGLSWMPITPGATLPFVGGANWVLWGDYPQQREIEFFDQDYTPLKHQRAIVQVTYVSGWANAVLTSSIAATGSQTAVVDTTLGMSVGQSLTVYDGDNTESVTVTAITDATHFTAVFGVTHTVSTTATIAISAIPQEIRMAAINACTGLVKLRGSEAFTMNSNGVGQVMKGGAEEEAIALAEYLLQPYRIEF